MRTIFEFLTGYREDFHDTDASSVRDSETMDAREAGSRFSRGNVAIQENAFVTTGDLERERNDLRQRPIRG